MTGETTTVTTPGILIRSWKGNEPRFSKPQRQALEAAAEADYQARLLGLDFAHRPVVSALLGVPRARVVYALQRNGDPCEPKYASDTGANVLMEPWSE